MKSYILYLFSGMALIALAAYLLLYAIKREDEAALAALQVRYENFSLEYRTWEGDQLFSVTIEKVSMQDFATSSMAEKE